MNELAGWLIDKSAYVRLPDSPDLATWANRIQRGLVSIATPTLLEIGFSVRNGEQWTAFQTDPPISQMPTPPSSALVDRRALEVQGLLAQRGHHRAAKVPDLLIAATAEIAGLTVLHVDKDFDLIAEVTGQPVERLTGDF
ncbi:MAG: PIN domain nuclease [Gordonia sp. (in: high G+C Gram-positive bacteria)]|uniref:PIN domain nuclease n=1 Tax=Gordonia sp. (in: high G+C Gram-positive bacteria) TaxID=84139 RepID=UPI0039E4CD7A